MRLSTKARYAVRAMIDLALHGDGDTITRDEIAARQDISPLYLSHILLRLSKAGLLTSTKGPGGGYHLGREPKNIRVGDIVRAVGEPLDLVPCTAKGRDYCDRAGTCAAHALWVRVAGAVRDTLDASTLEDLCQDARSLDAIAGEVATDGAVL